MFVIETKKYKVNFKYYIFRIIKDSNDNVRYCLSTTLASSIEHVFMHDGISKSLYDALQEAFETNLSKGAKL